MPQPVCTIFPCICEPTDSFCRYFVFIPDRKHPSLLLSKPRTRRWTTCPTWKRDRTRQCFATSRRGGITSTTRSGIFSETSSDSGEFFFFFSICVRFFFVFVIFLFEFFSKRAPYPLFDTMVEGRCLRYKHTPSSQLLQGMTFRSESGGFSTFAGVFGPGNGGNRVPLKERRFYSVGAWKM